MDNRIVVGYRSEHPKYGWFEVVKKVANKTFTIKFDKTGYEYNVLSQNIKKGRIKDIMCPVIFGVGYVGTNDNRATKKKSYVAWHNMIKRCYDSSIHEKRPTYQNVTVCDAWHCFATFEKWHDENCVDGWCLDKDILVKDNQIYSPETCCFVPNEINVLFTKRQNHRGDYPIGVSFMKASRRYNECYKASFTKNDNRTYIGVFKTEEEAFMAYKREKELYIKEVANKWKDKLAHNVYEALINYEVDIND